MEPSALSPLSAWESFYVIVGSGAAALTGLQFVVIVLGSEVGVGGESATRAFSTPTVVHFSAVLLVSALLSAPWPSLAGPGWGLGLTAAVGVLYTARVIRLAQLQTHYQPVLEDWLTHGVLPELAYLALLGAAVTLAHHPGPALFAVAGAALLLLFVGIHNAWDAAAFLASRRKGSLEPRDPE